MTASLQAEKQGGSPWLAILRREYRAQLVLAIAMPLFQMATGINAVVFFSPELFGGIGAFGDGAMGGLVASAVIGAVQVLHSHYHTSQRQGSCHYTHLLWGPATV